MDKYDKWVKAAVDKLNEDSCRGALKPQNESDVKCHLYCALLQTRATIKGLRPNRIVVSEFQFSGFQERFDLVIAKKKRDDFQEQLIVKEKETRRIVEVKETSQEYPTVSAVREGIKDDVDKLRRCRNTLKEKQSEALKYSKKPHVFFFFRGAGRNGISAKTEREIKTIEKELDDIILDWGPSC